LESAGEAPEERKSSARMPNTSVKVSIGQSTIATSEFVQRCSDMVNRSYGYNRITPNEIRQRLAMGDDEESANRVLHVAFDETGKLVGCCSSTLCTPWTGRNCGHWGLLVVDIDAQGTGVASELVRSAESRLAAAGLKQVQIEYEYTCGDAHSQRLHNWYEGVLGFSGGSTPTTRSGCTEWRAVGNLCR